MVKITTLLTTNPKYVSFCKEKKVLLLENDDFWRDRIKVNLERGLKPDDTLALDVFDTPSSAIKAVNQNSEYDMVVADELKTTGRGIDVAAGTALATTAINNGYDPAQLVLCTVLPQKANKLRELGINIVDKAILSELKAIAAQVFYEKQGINHKL